MLSSVSSEDAQDRSDRVLLTPWVKFLWEAYRNILELLRNNNRVERLYHETAQSGKLKNGESPLLDRKKVLQINSNTVKNFR